MIAIAILTGTANIKIDAVKKVVTYTYHAKNKKEAKAIMEGNYPQNLELFFHLLSHSGYYVENYRWYKDKKDPYIAFDVEEPI